MRKNIVAGNWKMNKTFSEGSELIKEITNLLNNNDKIKSREQLHIIIAPPFILLQKSAELVKDNKQISVAAQNCYTEEKGAYTGEISVAMIKSTGADYVIIGHSERRAYFKETNDMLAKKVDIALKNQLLPIFCCGESLEIRQAQNHFEWIKKQIHESLFHLNENDFKKLIIAYEPIWAIGTGITATSQQAQEIHAYIRSLIKEKYGDNIAENTTILYGGSCKPGNAKELFANPDVDGGLIGGASLKANDFVQIIDSM
jgi:triosephosphate isomerase